jgi:hypothetical protein
LSCFILILLANAEALLVQGKRIGKKKKTSVKSCNLNPYWNESFVFIIDEMDMKRVTLEMTVGTCSGSARS